MRCRHYSKSIDDMFGLFLYNQDHYEAIQKEKKVQLNLNASHAVEILYFVITSSHGVFNTVYVYYIYINRERERERTRERNIM